MIHMLGVRITGLLMFAAANFLTDHFGDTDGVLGLVGKHWHEVPRRETVRKWFRRASVASEWWPILLFVLEINNGEPVSLAPYFATGGEDGIFS